MREAIEARLEELRKEFQTGQQMLTQMDQQRTSLDQTLHRISGAIQVCEELLTAGEPTTEVSVPSDGSMDQ